jgi:hypothetical protein
MLNAMRRRPILLLSALLAMAGAVPPALSADLAPDPSQARLAKVLAASLPLRHLSR